ncbi:MAG: hypothetical protein RIT24_66, partial [Planctomycetota bacterium]
LYLLIFYTDKVGLSSSLAGVALGIGLVWDAVTDPVMGAVSDALAPRHGRRMFLWSGGLLSALGFWLVFAPPPLDGQTEKFLWLTFAFCFLNTGLTIINIPHVSMATEITDLPHERSTLFGWRFACMNIGAIVAAAAPEAFLVDVMGPVAWVIAGLVFCASPATWAATVHGAIVAAAAPEAILDDANPRTVDVMGPFAWVIAGLVVCTSFATWAATAHVRFQFAPASKEPFLRQMRDAFANPAFRPLLIASVLATVGIGANSATALYYYGYCLDLSSGDAHQLIAVALVVFTVSILVWVALGRRFGKSHPVAYGAMLLGLGTSAAYPMLPSGNFVWPLVVSSVGLGSLLGCIVLIDSLVTDVIDFDTVRSRARRSGVYFGVWRFAAKIARGIAIGGTGWLLEVVGFVPNQDQPEHVRIALSWIFGPGVGVWFVAAALVLLRYRFDDAKQAQVQSILRRRNGAAAR